MDESNRLPGWLRSGLIGLGLFLAGGALAFGYSYRPLHGALSWKVEALEQRLDERNRELLKQSDELARLRSDDAERIDPERFAKIERELETTKSALAQAETDLERAEKKRKDANASASRWRKRYEEMRDHATRTAAAPPVVQEPSPAPVPQAGSVAGADGVEPRSPAAPNAAAAPDPNPPVSPEFTESGMLPPEPLSGPDIP